MSNSFLEMFNWDQVDIVVSINEASISEHIEPDGLTDFSPMMGMVLRGKIDSSRRGREWDNEVRLPAYPVFIAIEQRPCADLSNKEHKFPLGMIKFEGNETYIRAFVRQELYNTISQQLFAVVHGLMECTITIPFVDSYAHATYYPILGYGFTIKAVNSQA